MFIPEKNQYNQEVERFDDKIQKDLLDLYDHLLGVKEIKSVQRFAKALLVTMFTPQYSAEASIPLKFLDTGIGKVMFTILFGVAEKMYTINDIVQMSISEDRPKGVSKAWLNKEIKNGILKGTYQSGIWVFTQSQVDDYLARRGYQFNK